MRLADGSYINNVARLEKTEEIERESLEVDEEIARMPKPEVSVEIAEAEAEEEPTAQEDEEI